MASCIPQIGDKVKVTPYARRNFDGTKVNDNSKFCLFGTNPTPLPFDRPKGERLAQFYDWINEVRISGDRNRYLTHFLVDANAKNFVVHDNEVDAEQDLPARFNFKINAEFFKGTIEFTVLEDYIFVCLWQQGKLFDEQIICLDELNYQFAREFTEILDPYGTSKISIEIVC